MKYTVQQEKNHIILFLSGSLSNESLIEIKKLLKDSLIASEMGILLDLTDIDFICSAALGMFFSLYTDAKASKKRFLLCNVNEDLRKLFHITGVNKHIEIFPSIQEAQESFN